MCFSQSLIKDGHLSVDDIGIIDNDVEKFSGCQGISIVANPSNVTISKTGDLSANSACNSSPHSPPYYVKDIDTGSPIESNISHNQIMDVASRLSGASQRNKKLGTLISGFMLHMSELADQSVFTEVDDKYEITMVEKFPQLIHLYKSSFSHFATSSSLEKMFH